MDFYRSEDILQRRQSVAEQLQNGSSSIVDGSIHLFCDADLEKLFTWYDRIFFRSQFALGGPRDIQFRFNGRLSSSAGLTKASHHSHKTNPLYWHYNISLSKPLLQAFPSAASSVTVNGIEPATQLEALQLILEHELCHVIEFVSYGDSNCRGQRFRSLAARLFGHTDVVHTLRGNQRRQPAFSVGETVCFDWKSASLRGVISRITKRATVMVPSRAGDYADRAGKRYQKYYVPLAKLQKCEERYL